MQETFNSLVRLSAAITVFGVQQVQTVIGAASPADSIDRLREGMDRMAAAVTANIDESKLPVLDRTVETAAGVVKTTSDWFQGIVRAVTPVPPGPGSR
jgi:hypothetical protein